MKQITVFLVFISVCGKTFSQSYNAQRTQVLVTNVLSNALIGGVGALFNKKPEDKMLKLFAKSFFKGSVGGLIKYSAKYQTYYLGNPSQVIHTPLNRLYFFLGHSVTMNAAFNRKFLERYYCNFYGIEMRIGNLEGRRFQARLSLATLATALAFGIRGYEFNLYETIEQGQLFFDVNRNRLPGTAQAGFNCLAIEANSSNSNYGALPHEMIHTYQMYDYFGFSSIYDRWSRPFYDHNKVYRFLSNYFVADYEVLFFSGFYLAQRKPTYYRNYFEFEAQHFRSRAAIKR